MTPFYALAKIPLDVGALVMYFSVMPSEKNLVLKRGLGLVIGGGPLSDCPIRVMWSGEGVLRRFEEVKSTCLIVMT